MRIQDVPVDPNDVSENVRDVMSRPEFRYEKSLLDRIGEWIADQLEKLFGAPSGAPGGATFGGGAGAFIAWLIIAAAALAVIATIVYVVMKRVRRPAPDDEPDLVSEVEHRHPAGHWASEAERFEAEGLWKEALRCRYRELVRTLVDRRQLPDVAGRTTGELRVDLHRSTPNADAAFDRATLLFELAWYADAPTGPDESTAFRTDASSVLDQEVAHRFETAGLLSLVDDRTEVPV